MTDTLRSTAPAHAALPRPVRPPTGPTGPADGVQVAGLGRTGMAVARVLAAAGAGPLGLWDPRPVAPEDLGTGFLPADLGRSRASAAERRLQDLHPGLPVFAHHGPTPLVLGAVTVAVGGDGRLDEDLVARAQAAEHPLLPVVVGEVGTTVGPWTLSGAAGCALCLPTPGAPGDPAGERIVTALRTALVVHDELLATGPSALIGAALLVSVRAEDGARIPVPALPGCPCGPDPVDGIGLVGDVGVLAPDGEPVPAADQAVAGPWRSSSTVGP